MTPWGFRESSRGHVAVSTSKDRRDRAELGETAILLCTQLGITEDQLGALREVLLKATLSREAPTETPLVDPQTPPDLVAELERLRGSQQAQA